MVPVSVITLVVTLVVGMTWALGALGAPGSLRTVTTQPVRAQVRRDNVVARARALWEWRHTRSAIELLQAVADDPQSDARADAQLLLGDIYFFKGWESENAFPGWHEEPEYRSRALTAFRTAQAARPDWFAPHERLGRALLREERPREALAEFTAALQRAPDETSARVGLWRALVALGQREGVALEIAKLTTATDPESLGAARHGYLLLGRRDEADSIGGRLLEAHPSSGVSGAVLADRVDAARAAKRYAEVRDQASRFIRRFPSDPRLVDVYDALIDAYQADVSWLSGVPGPAGVSDAIDPADAVVAAVDARVKLRGDPGPMLAGANLLIARTSRLDKAIALAEAASPAAERFINENAGAYKMADKARATLGRTRASATDLVGWAYFLQKHLAQAESKLLEAERLSRGQDLANQFHLGELARAKGELEHARDHYLTGLTLTGPGPILAAAQKSLADVFVQLGNHAAGFDAYLAAELARRREARHSDLLKSLVDHPAPPLRLTDVTGQMIDLTALRGKVVVLNFFSSW